MIEQEDIDIDGTTFTLSKFPAVAGRSIVVQYTTSGLPKVGDYAVNESIMLKLMSYVSVSNGAGGQIKLSTQALIDNHVGSWETLGRLEVAMMRYNCSFFADGRLSTLFDDIAQAIPQWISKILTALSPPSLPTEKPLSTS